MKRGAPLKRKTGLRRGEFTSRSTLDFAPERKPLKRSRRKRRPRLPDDTRRAVRARSKGKCVVCVWEGATRPRKADHLHHVLDVQNMPALLLVADGIVGTCREHHIAHHYQPGGRIPRAALPPCVLALAEDVGPVALAHLERFYPK